jgi:hypothetical protein
MGPIQTPFFDLITLKLLSEMASTESPLNPNCVGPLPDSVLSYASREAHLPSSIRTEAVALLNSSLTRLSRCFIAGCKEGSEQERRQLDRHQGHLGLCLHRRWSCCLHHLCAPLFEEESRHPIRRVSDSVSAHPSRILTHETWLPSRIPRLLVKDVCRPVCAVGLLAP